MKGEIEPADFKGLIIDRSKSQCGIESQIDILAGGFRKVGNSKGIPEGASRFSDGEGYFLPNGGNSKGYVLPGRVDSLLEWGGKEKEERPKRKRRGKAKPVEVELDLGGRYYRGNMLMSSLENGQEAHFGSFGQF